MLLDERKEDFLENIYVNWRNGGAYSIDMAMRDLAITREEAKAIEKILLTENYIETSDDGMIHLTLRGKEKASSVMTKHQHLKEFLKLVCNVEEDIADANACRIEHVISDDVIAGIRSFMADGKIATRQITGSDLSVLYEPGTYTFDVGIYEAETRYPRRLARETEWLDMEIEAVVKETESSFILRTLSGEMDMPMRILHEGEWIQVAQGKSGYEIRTDAFVYDISGELPMIEGDATIAFTREEFPKEKEIRIMNVHLW